MTPAVAIRNLHFSYTNSDGALHDLTFTVGDGECVAVVGPNGAGKSTLLLHLNGLLPENLDVDQGGAISIFGRKISSKTVSDIRRDVGLLFQDADDQLFCPTVFEDVAFGPRQFGLDTIKLEDRVAKALAAVGLPGFERRAPNHLSGGEKRRICLATVLACEPRILALDEPSSGLDPRARREFITLLQTLCSTRIIATHDLEMVLDLCPRTMLLDGGTLVADGPSVELLGNERLMIEHGLEVPASLRSHSKIRSILS
jgi:energy-coupling factor transporter ATP-binding protein EcfA2